jgi:hypothetical protein
MMDVKLIKTKDVFGSDIENAITVKKIDVTSVTEVKARKSMSVEFQFQCPCCDKWLTGKVETV